LELVALYLYAKICKTELKRARAADYFILINGRIDDGEVKWKRENGASQPSKRRFGAWKTQRWKSKLN
jgi:hypothetical protein